MVQSTIVKGVISQRTVQSTVVKGVISQKWVDKALQKISHDFGWVQFQWSYSLETEIFKIISNFLKQYLLSYLFFHKKQVQFDPYMKIASTIHPQAKIQKFATITSLHFRKKEFYYLELFSEYGNCSLFIFAKKIPEGKIYF